MLYLLKQVLHSPEASGTKSVSLPFLPSPETSVPLVSDVTRWADWTQRETTKCPVFVTFQHVPTENKEETDGSLILTLPTAAVLDSPLGDSIFQSLTWEMAL